MALKLVTVPIDPEDAKREWLENADPEILACRGQGHAFPKLKPGKLNPRHNWLEHDQRQGMWQLAQLCRDGCGTVRLVTTNPGGTDIDLPAVFRYRRTKPGYKTPRGVRVSRRECFAETSRRRREDTTGKTVVPQVKFLAGA